MKFTVYDSISGDVLRIGECPDDSVSGQAFKVNEAVTVGHFPGDEWYRGTQSFLQRREMLLTRQGALLRGLPIPCVVRIEGDEYVCEDGDIELSFEYPGSYTLRFEAHGYKDRELTVQWPLSPMQEAPSPS
jgi:hypothetical protein